MKEMRKLPAIGSDIIVWPGLKTVRDDAHKPVRNAAGEIQKAPARVRDHRGELITNPVPVLVTMHYHRLIGSGHLEWSTKQDYLDKTRAERSEQTTASESRIRKPRNQVVQSVENTDAAAQ